MFDVIIIGGGPGGYVAAIRCAQNGLKVACVEKIALGGTCLNVGCIPSKSLLEASYLYYKSNGNLEKYGISSKATIDISKMMSYKNDTISSLVGGIEMLFKKNKIEKIKGSASFVDKNTISVDGLEYKAKNFIIATGSVVSEIPNIKIDEEKIVSSIGALSLKSVPKNMAVIGGGVIGIELGSVWKNLGAEVDVVEYSDRIIATMDNEISSGLKKILEKSGIKFILSTEVIEAKTDKSSVKVSICNRLDNSEQTKNYDVVLVAVGRKPCTENLCLDSIGVKTNQRGFLVTDKNFKVADNIYAIGDVIGGVMLAHKAEEEGIAVADLLVGKYSHVNYDNIPNVIYTHPEVASIGKTEDELKKSGVNFTVGKFSMLANSRAKAVSDTDGFVKILSCPKTSKVYGCHIISRDAGNLIHEIATAIEVGANAEDIAMTCHAHPTLNEAVKEAAMIAAGGKAIHS